MISFAEIANSNKNPADSVGHPPALRMEVHNEEYLTVHF
jgi:hypothetical protein